MNNNDDNLHLDNLDDPDSLLMARLMRQSGEIELLKLERDVYKTHLDVTNKLLERTIEEMMEPIILREIIDTIEDPNYKSYLNDGTTIIEYYKMVLESVVLDRKANGYQQNEQY